MASMAHLSLLLLVAASVSLLASSSASGISTSSVEYWNKALPNVELPRKLSERVSPLDSSQAVAYSKAELGTASAGGRLCKAAHLYCNAQEFAAFRQLTAACTIKSNFLEPSYNEMGQQQVSGSAGVFYRESALVEGAHITLGDQKSTVPTTAFLPRGLAHHLLELHGGLFGNIPTSSLLAQESLQSFQKCKIDAHELLHGETAFCAYSLEDLSDGLQTMLSSSPADHTPKSLRVLSASAPATTSSSLVSGELVHVQLEVESFGAYLACHTQTYPFAVFYCHHIPNTRVYSATVHTHAGESIHAVGICHLDTSQWHPLHMAFVDLHSMPGHTEACHWTHENSLVFVPYPASP